MVIPDASQILGEGGISMVYALDLEVDFPELGSSSLMKAVKRPKWLI
jgi:hypothetical protein